MCQCAAYGRPRFPPSPGEHLGKLAVLVRDQSGGGRSLCFGRIGLSLLAYRIQRPNRSPQGFLDFIGVVRGHAGIGCASQFPILGPGGVV